MTRVLLVDDHALFRKGLRALLGTMDDIEVVGEAQNGPDAVAVPLVGTGPDPARPADARRRRVGGDPRPTRSRPGAAILVVTMRRTTPRFANPSYSGHGATS